MAAATVPKLYRSVIDDVLNSVREVFLDDGVDEQVLHELKLTWEKKVNESKAVDNNAREPDPVPVTKHSNRSNNSNASHSSRNSQHNREQASQQQNQQQQQQITQQQQQQQQQPQHVSPLQSHQSISVVHSQNSQNQAVNHISGGSGGHTNISPHLQLQPGTNIVVGPSGVSYTTNDHIDGQKNVNPPQVHQKLVLVQGIGQSQPYLVSASGGTFNNIAITPELLNQIAFQQHQHQQQQQQQQHGNVITQTQPTVVHHTNNVGISQNAIQYASASRLPLNAATRPPQPPPNRVVQLDGAHDTSDEDDDEEEYREQDEDNDDNDDDINDDDNEGQGEDEEPLNSEDDVSDEDPTELFDTDNVVVCQYDKITRSRNKWKFHLKDGIMNLQGKDYVFQKAVGDAEW